MSSSARVGDSLGAVLCGEHNGEDSYNWEAFYHPIGDTRKSLETFASLLRGVAPAGVERWEEGLVP